MRKAMLLLFVCLPFTFLNAQVSSAAKGRYVLVVHGGAGTILRSQLTPEKEQQYNAGLQAALAAGQQILENNGSSLDAVEAAVRVLEDNPLFNAGKGAVFTSEGRNELDAAIMDGKTLAAGAVAGVTVVKNPISAARAVMEKSPHVLLSGKGADEFARASGLEIVDPSYFHTPERWKGLQRIRERDSLQKENKQTVAASSPDELLVLQKEKYGTVGAVALDQFGNLAAATSTGGMTNKKWGRVGDAPIIGAGTYANNGTVAISATGWGEYFLRLVMAKTISDRMEYGNQTLSQAANEMVMLQLPNLGGDGGLIAVDKQGNIAMPFCTEGMYRAYIRKDGADKPVQTQTAIFK